MAEVLYPVHSEIGKSVVGAVVFEAGKIRGSKMKKLQNELPPGADVWYRGSTFRIEVEVSSGDRSNRVAVHKMAKLVRAAIRRGLNVVAGLCPVESSAQVLRVIRPG